MEKRKKRTHEEVVAAREAYAKEKHDRLVDREAKKAERARLLQEREERRKLREARKNMTEQERQNSVLESRIQKARKKGRKAEKDDTVSKYGTYVGEIRPGDKVKAYFAGCPIVGELLQIEYAEDEESRATVDIYTILVNDIGNPYDGMKCPLRREKIIAKYN